METTTTQRLDFTTPLDHGDDREPPEEPYATWHREDAAMGLDAVRYEGEQDVPPCVECGERPWGYGYCGELCRECSER